MFSAEYNSQSLLDLLSKVVDSARLCLASLSLYDFEASRTGHHGIRRPTLDEISFKCAILGGLSHYSSNAVRIESETIAHDEELSRCDLLIYVEKVVLVVELKYLHPWNMPYLFANQLLIPQSSAPQYRVNCFYNLPGHKHTKGQLTCEQVRAMQGSRSAMPQNLMDLEKSVLIAALPQNELKDYQNDPEKNYFVLRLQLLRHRLQHLDQQPVLEAKYYDRNTSVGSRCAAALAQLQRYMDSPNISKLCNSHKVVGMVLVGCGRHVVVHLTDAELHSAVREKYGAESRVVFFDGKACSAPAAAASSSTESNKCALCQRLAPSPEPLSWRRVPSSKEPDSFVWQCDQCLRESSLAVSFSRNLNLDSAN